MTMSLVLIVFSLVVGYLLIAAIVLGVAKRFVREQLMPELLAAFWVFLPLVGATFGFAWLCGFTWRKVFGKLSKWAETVQFKKDGSIEVAKEIVELKAELPKAQVVKSRP